MNRAVEYLLLSFVSVIVVGSLAGALLDRPVFVSYAYSGSMTPTISKGDVFFINPLSRNPEVGDIVVFNAGGTWTVHRIVGVVEDGYITKGDNNVATDQQSKKIPPISRSQIGGKVITFQGKPIVIRGAGTYIQNSLSGRTKMLVAGVLIILGALAITGDSKKGIRKKKKSKVMIVKFKTLYVLASALLLVMVATSMFVSWQVFPINYAVTSAGGTREGWYLPGEVFTQEIAVKNLNFYPMFYYVSAPRPVTKISEDSFQLTGKGEKKVLITIKSPEETSVYSTKVTVNSYLPLLPRSATTYLYRINPIMPVFGILLEISLFLGILYMVSGIGNEDIVKIRTRKSSLVGQIKREVFRL